MIFFCQSYYFEASPVAGRKIHIYFSSKRRVYDSLIVRYCHYSNNSVCAGMVYAGYAGLCLYAGIEYVQLHFIFQYAIF